MPAGTHAAVHDDRNDTVEIYINGAFFLRPEAKVSVFDSAFMVGDGIWEGIRLHNGRFAFLDRHLDRLFQASAATRIDLEMTREEVTAALYATVERNQMTDDVHVRLMVSRGTKSTPSQHPSNLVSGRTIVIVAEHKRADPGVASRGVTLFTATVRRPPPDTLDQRLNSHSKLHEVIALIQATEAGADEALMLDPTGAVATCNATNFFLVSKGEVWTSTGHYNLHGITRGVVLDEARAAGIPTRETAFSLTEVYAADECFVTGTFGGLTPVRSVDGRVIGSGSEGPMTGRLRGLYEAAVARSVSR
jgi:branched-chain amino acid aminotransferase